MRVRKVREVFRDGREGRCRKCKRKKRGAESQTMERRPNMTVSLFPVREGFALPELPE